MGQIEAKLGIYALGALLAPVARFCLRNSFKFQDFLECSKAAFIRVAKEELEEKSEAVSASRLSVMTGMHRRDVSKFKAGQPRSETERNLISKVIGQWRTNKKYLSTDGEARDLGLGVGSEFSELVNSVSQDLKPASVLFELERIGAVERIETGARLRKQAYVPKGDIKAGLQILERDLNDLICAVEENLFVAPRLPNHHLRLEYDKVRADAGDDLKVLLLKEAHAFQVKMRDLIAKFDQDANPDPDYKGGFSRVVFGTFGRVHGGEK